LPMGGLTYIFGFVLNWVGASIVAALIALVSLMLPARRMQIGDSENPPSKRKRAVLVFMCVWLLLMLYGCIEMFRTHHDEMDRTESARLITGLVDREDQIIHAEHVAKGDMAQTYLMVRTTALDVEHFVNTRHITAFKYDAHSARDRGWPVPQWWPAKPCKGGVTYQADPFASPPSAPEDVINWCPTEQLAYVQHFDY